MAERPKNPYVGPRSFNEDDEPFFFGRDEEQRQLTSLIIAHQAVLLYAQSGAGKTSLLRASVIPELKRRRQVMVLPVSRVYGELPPGIDLQQVKNIFVFNILHNLAGADGDPAQLTGFSLKQGLQPFFTPSDQEPRLRPRLLIIDQFEELFTRFPERYQDRAEFFQDLQAALADYPQFSLILSMREDYVAELDAYAGYLPDRLRTRFRMERLTQKCALAAIQEPATKMGRPFAAGVAEGLVENLSAIFVETSDEKGRSINKLAGNYVEPVHLQIVCFDLWERLPADHLTIRPEDIVTFGNVNQALAVFYDRIVAQVSWETKVSQRRLRAWFEDKLITPSLTRSLVYRDINETAGLPNVTADRLKDAYLIRGEIRSNGQTWYELAHDRLIEPVRYSNEIWRKQYLTYFQSQAALWEHSNKNPNLLLSVIALQEAEKSNASQADPLEPYEAAFLQASQEAAKKSRLEGEVKGLWPIRKLAIYETVCFLISIGFYILTFALSSLSVYLYFLVCPACIFLAAGVICGILIIWRDALLVRGLSRKPKPEVQPKK